MQLRRRVRTPVSAGIAWGDIYDDSHACAHRLIEVMEEGIKILVHGLAGAHYHAVMPRTPAWWDLRKQIKINLDLPKRAQIILFGNKHVLPQENMEALGRDKIEAKLVIRRPDCAQCGSTQASKWCGGCYGVLYCLGNVKVHSCIFKGCRQVVACTDGSSWRRHCVYMQI